MGNDLYVVVAGVAIDPEGDGEEWVFATLLFEVEGVFGGRFDEEHMGYHCFSPVFFALGFKGLGGEEYFFAFVGQECFGGFVLWGFDGEPLGLR